MFLILALPSGVVAQSPVTPPPAATQGAARLRLFLDCATHCDREYLRSEITVVDWVTDKEASDIYLLATSLRTGSGGNEVALQFIGQRGALEGMTDRHTYQTGPDASLDEFRSEFARVLKLGLVRYLLAANRGANLSLTDNADPDAPAIPVVMVDPWNSWIFNVKLDGQFDAESQEKGTELEMELNASRVTETWKTQLEWRGTIDRNSYTLEDGSTFRATKDRWYANAFAIRSLGPQFSAGAEVTFRGAKRENLNLRTRVAAAVEYDLFPYSEAHRRRLILAYHFGVNRYDYVEETVYGKLQETRLTHTGQIDYKIREPWGEASLATNVEAFANDLSQSELGVKGGVSLRVAKGLNIELESSYSKVKNQITLPKGDATNEEIFLDLRQRATNYKAQMKIGLSYTFGSFLNSIVNPRFNTSK